MKAHSKRSSESSTNEEELIVKYYETLDRLEALADQLKAEKRKVRLLEDEIDELQAEQELERLDYTETIKKQQEQIEELLKSVTKPRKNVRFAVTKCPSI